MRKGKAKRRQSSTVSVIDEAFSIIQERGVYPVNEENAH